MFNMDTGTPPKHWNSEEQEDRRRQVMIGWALTYTLAVALGVAVAIWCLLH